MLPAEVKQGLKASVPSLRAGSPHNLESGQAGISLTHVASLLTIPQIVGLVYGKPELTVFALSLRFSSV